MFRLDTKTKNYVFNNMVNGCKNNGFDYTTSLDNNGNIKALKITHNNVTYNISDIGIMGIAILVKEDYNGHSSLWNIKQLFDFIKENNK